MYGNCIPYKYKELLDEMFRKMNKPHPRTKVQATTLGGLVKFLTILFYPTKESKDIEN